MIPSLAPALAPSFIPAFRTARRALVVAALLMPAASPAVAASCYDLWYERNLIFADNGYCFSSDLGRRTFGNAGCWTTDPDLAPWERSRVADIRRQERARGCNVN